MRLLPFASSFPCRVEADRPLLDTLIEDLRLLDRYRPRALEIVALCARKLAQPIRDQRATRRGPLVGKGIG